MLIFRGGAVSRHDLSPSELQAHVEKWYRWSDELARQGRRNAGTALDNQGDVVRGHERVVTDASFVFAAGVTAGIDAALLVAAKLRGVDEAQAVQLFIQYAPEPPFSSGTPETAPPHVLRTVTDRGRRTFEQRLETARRIAASWV